MINTVGWYCSIYPHKIYNAKKCLIVHKKILEFKSILIFNEQVFNDESG